MKSPFLLLLLFSASTLLAQPDSGTAAAGDPVASVQSGDWMDIATWDCDCIPTESSEVAVQDGHLVQLAEGDTARTASLVVTNGGVLDIPEGARMELLVSLASVGEISGSGFIAFIGDEPKTCGPATLRRLACGSASVTLTDTLIITGELALESAAFSTEGKLVLSGESGMTAMPEASISGTLTRRYSWEKNSIYAGFKATGLEGTTGAAFLNLPGTSYLKEWLEPSTAYQDYTNYDVLPIGKGIRLNTAQGVHECEFSGEALLEAEVIASAASINSSWKGWNLLANPLTGYVNLEQVGLSVDMPIGPIYVWVDSLETWASYIGGLGQFGHNGIIAPGEAFWLISDTTKGLHFGSNSLVPPPTIRPQIQEEESGILKLELTQGLRREQCLIEFGNGSPGYSYGEDAEYNMFFRGRNDLDLYSKSDDDVSLMINRTDTLAQIIPLWVKALPGDSVSFVVGSVPDDICLFLEDVVTGWSGFVEEGVLHRFQVNSTSETHRFNLVVMGGVEATVNDAICANASDGSIVVVGPDPTGTFSLTDAEGNPAGTFLADSIGGVFNDLSPGLYTVTALSQGCGNMSRSVEVGAGGSGNSLFTIDATPDHIGCYDDHGGVALEIEGGLAPYTVTWSHGDTGESIEVETAGILEAVITDAAGCSDSTTVEVLAAPHVQAGIEVANPVLTLIDGEAEVHFENTSTGATGYQWNFGDGATSIAENPLHAYTAAGAYTVGLNAWNDYCSDTYQVVVTVETVSAVGDLAGAMDASIERTIQGWSITHTAEAFEVEVFDLTGRLILTSNGMPGLPAMLDVASMPSVALVHWRGLQTGQQGTWRVAR